MIDATNKMLQEVITDIAKQQENLILEQLGELITRGLLVVEKTEPVLTGGWERDRDKYTVKLEQKIRLVLKDQEYIEKLEAENAEYKDLIKRLNEALERQLKNG